MQRVQALLAFSFALGLTSAACQGWLGSTTERPDDVVLTDEVVLPGGLHIRGQAKYFRVVRLTHEQWENSVRDVLLLGEAPGLSAGFYADPPDGTFSNNERALYVTDPLRKDYQRAAEELGELVATDPTRLSRLSAAGDSTGFIAAVGRRAFRRELTLEEKSAFAVLWAAGAGHFGSGDAFVDGARIFLEALLQSPHFLYRIELSPVGQRLSGVEVATKLSFVLRNTTPSDALLDAAGRGELDTDEGVIRVAAELLAGAEARRALERFHRELYGLDRYHAILKSPTLFPTFGEELNPTLLEADVKFFDHVFVQGLGFREIMTSDAAFVNGATAEFYGLTSSSASLELVRLDGSRPGFLTRLGFLAYNANLAHPDPIHRGVDVNNRILCAHLEPPVGEIPPLPEPVEGQTNRERVVAHTNEGVCANCHEEIINPPGFSLESFDAVGRMRTTDNGKPVDTTGTFLIGETPTPFADIGDLTTQLAESSLAHSCYVARLAEFAFARDLGAAETELVTALQGRSLEDDASIRDLLLGLIGSPEFTRARSSP